MFIGLVDASDRPGSLPSSVCLQMPRDGARPLLGDATCKALRAALREGGDGFGVPSSALEAGFVDPTMAHLDETLRMHGTAFAAQRPRDEVGAHRTKRDPCGRCCVHGLLVQSFRGSGARGWNSIQSRMCF